MTYVTGFFLVFAGMLIGYFLWYRDRSEDDARQASFSRENDELRSTITLSQNSHEKLSERFARQKGQLNVLQQLCDDWSSSREQSERDRAQLELEVAEKEQRYEQAAAELQTEKQKRIELEDEAHQLAQQQIEKINEMENDWRERHSKAETSLVQNRAELKSATEERERLAEQLYSSEARVAELESDLAGQESLLETATKNAGGLEREYVSIESSLKESSDLLKQSRAECAVAVSAQKVAEQSLSALQKSFEESQYKNEELSVQIANLNTLEAQNSVLQQSLHNSVEQLEKVILQRDDALDSDKMTHARAVGLQKRIENQESTIHGLRNKRDDALESLKQEMQRRSELEQVFEEKVTSLESQLQDQAAEVHRRSGELASQIDKDRSEFKNRLSVQSETIAQLTKNRDQISRELEGAHQELNQSRSQTRELTSKLEELKTTCLRISELEKLVQRRDQEDRQLVEDLQTLREQYDDSCQSHHRLQAEFDRVNIESQDRESEFAETQQQLNQVTTKLKASEETIRALRRERAAVLTRLANYRTVAEPDNTVISFTEAMLQRQREAVGYDAEYRGPTSQHAVRGLVYTQAPETRDDLKLISGIADVLEARLNDYGIYTFKQIMEWEPEAIEEFSRLLAFRERIQRDDWIKQARYFYDQKQAQNQTSQSAA